MKARISAPLAALLLAAGCVQGTDTPPAERLATMVRPVQASLDWMLGVEDEDEDGMDDEEDEDGFWPFVPAR